MECRTDVAAQPAQPRWNMRCSTMDMPIRAGAQGLRLVGEQREPRVEAFGCQRNRCLDDPVATYDVFARDTSQIERAALASRADFGGPILGVDAPPADFSTGRRDSQGGADLHLARVHSSCDYCAETRQRKPPIDREPEM